MRHPAITALGLAASLFALSAGAIVDNSTTARNSSYYTGSILDKSEGVALYMAADARVRVNAAASGGTYNLTMPTTNFLGILWFYCSNAANTGDIDMTIDGTDACFAQCQTGGGDDILNSTAADPFVLNAFGYSSTLSLSGINTQQTAESFMFSNTVMRIRNPGNNYDISLAYTGGIVSFAGRNGDAMDGGYIQFPQQVRDGTFDFSFTDADVYVPAIRLYARYSRSNISVSGGSFTCNGGFTADYNETNRSLGTNTVSFTGGAKVTQKGDYSMGTDSSVSTRTSILTISGEGTTYEQTGGKLTAKGNSELEFSDGAVVKLRSQTYIAETAGSTGKVSISGDDTRVLVAVKEGSTFYLGQGGSGTITMTGGYFGRDDTEYFLIFSMGNGAASDAVFNLSGGAIGMTNTSSRIDLGSSGNAALNISGGELYVGGEIRMGAGTSQTSAKTSSFTMTGGKAYVRSSFSACYLDSAYRRSEITLNGGELTCDSLVTYNTVARGRSGTSVFTADGGTLKPVQNRVNAVWPFINEGFDTFALGANGLTIDTDGKDVVTTASMSNKSGEDGLLVKKGAGTLTFVPASYDVANTRVEGGTFSVTNEAISLSTALVVTNGATLSTVGTCGTLTLSSFAVSGATLALDPGDMIRVTGDASIEDLTLSFSSLPELDGAAVAFLEVDGNVSESSRTALKRAFCENICAMGAGVRVSLSTDGETGKTTVSVSYATDVPMDESTYTVWNGSGAWGASGSWSAGVPTSAKTAAFTADVAAKEVAVPSGAQTGSIVFGVDGYELLGGPLAVVAEQGFAQIAVDAGDQSISADLEAYAAKIGVPVAAGSSLSVSGALRAGGVEKSGAGKLVLGATNALMGTSSSSGGILELADAQALNGAKQLVLAAGTLAVNAADGSESDLSGADIFVTAPSAPVIVDAETDVAFGDFAVTGRLVKRGAGTLTIDASRASATPVLTTAKGSGSAGGPASSATTTFPADGSAPDIDYAGLTVAEGNLVLKNGSFSSSGSIVVGMNMPTVASQAKLTLDNAKFSAATAAAHFFVGFGAARSDSQQTTPSLVMLNGSQLYVDTLQGGYGNANNPGATICAITNSAIYCSYACNLTDHSASKCPAVMRMKSSTLLSPASSQGGISLHGPVDAVFDNSVLGTGPVWGEATGRTFMSIKTWNLAYPTGTVSFVNGTLARISKFANFNANYIGGGFSFVWDDSQWDYGDDDYELDSFSNSRISFVMRGKGIVLAPAENTTFTTHQAFVGDGGMVKRGAGTVAFDEGTYQFSGTCEVAEGTLDLSAAGTLSDPAFSGGGTVKGLTANAATIRLEAEDGWTPTAVPTFEDASVGRCFVDFGRTAENPLPTTLPEGLVVAHFTGAAPNVSRWRLCGTGLVSVGGTFSVTAGGDVLMTARQKGITILIR